jgi:hypothetical protein
MTYQQELETLAEKRADAEWKAENLRGLYLIKSTFVQILDCTANDRLLEEYCDPEPCSLEKVQFALENGSPLFAALALRTESDARESFARIISERSSGNAKSKEWVFQNLLGKIHVSEKYQNHPIAGMDKHSTVSLQAQAEAVSTAADLRGRSNADLKQIIRTSTDPRLVGNVQAAKNAANQVGPPEIPETLTRREFNKLPTSEKLKAIRKYCPDDPTGKRLNDFWAKLEGRVETPTAPLIGERQALANLPATPTLPEVKVPSRKEFANLAVADQRNWIRKLTTPKESGADVLNRAWRN